MTPGLEIKNPTQETVKGRANDAHARYVVYPEELNQPAYLYWLVYVATSTHDRDGWHAEVWCIVIVTDVILWHWNGDLSGSPKS